MRKTLKALLAGTAFIALTLASCTDPNSMASSTAGIIDNDDDTTLKDNNGKSDKDIVQGAGSFGDNFIRGFDASAVDYYETLSANKISEWKDTDGTAREFFHILKRHGYDTVRLRIWNDPSNVVDPNDTPPTGDNTLERTVSMAKRIKAAGLKLMLDFHYSDTWADPSKQFVPKDWQDLDSEDKVAEAVSSYTTEVLEALYKSAGVVPAYVQIGNEINNGLLLHTGTTNSKTEFKYAAGNTSDTVKKYLSAASKAVRDFDKDIKIIIHVASSNSPTKLLDTLKSANLDYDIIGLSYYPWENSHGTISAMKDKIKDWKNAYGKPVMIAECSAQVDGANSGDNSNVSERTYSYMNMKDPATGILYSDITEDEDKPGAVKGSVENAKAILRHIMQETYTAHGIGCVAWGGEMRGDWNRAMFSWSGEAWDNIDAFNYSPADGYPYEDGDDGDDDDSGAGGGTDSGDVADPEVYTMTVTLTFEDGFSPSKLDVTYGYTDNTKTETIEVLNSATSVSFEVSSLYKNPTGWMAVLNVIAYDSSGARIDGVEFKGSNNWFEFSAGASVSLKYGIAKAGDVLYSADYSANGGISCVVEASSLSSLSISAIIVEATNCDWSKTSGEWLISVYSNSEKANPTKVSWIDNTHYKVEITDSSIISAFKTTGIYIAGSSGMTCSLTISYY